MKPTNYHSIPVWDPKDTARMNIPGIYCKGCGESFALYFYSADQPDDFDENNKPFYHSCFKCCN